MKRRLEISALLAKYETGLRKRGYKPLSIYNVDHALYKLFSFLSWKPIEKIGRSDVINYVRTQQASGKAAGTMTVELRIFLNFFGWYREYVAGSNFVNPALCLRVRDSKIVCLQEDF